MKWWRELEYVGWGIFLLIFAVLTPACIYFIFQVTYDTAHPVVRGMFGLFIAAGLAGLVAAGLNEYLHRRTLGREAETGEVGAEAVEKASRRQPQHKKRNRKNRNT